MTCSYRELRRKEVLCVGDGKRLGQVSDLEFTPEGTLLSLVTTAPCGSAKELFRRPEGYRVLWGQICRFGEDLILVQSYCPILRGKCE